MKYLNALLILVQFAAIILGGCSIKPKTEKYFPFNPGYTWKYKNSDGTSTIINIKGEVSDATQNSFHFFKVSQLDAYGTVIRNSDLYYKFTDAKGYYYGKASNPFGAGLPILKFPLKTGMSWVISKGKEYSSLAEVEKREAITVPAGTFDCYKVSYKSKNGTAETYVANIWFGRETGIVKAAIGDKAIVSELIEKNF